MTKASVRIRSGLEQAISYAKGSAFDEGVLCSRAVSRRRGSRARKINGHRHHDRDGDAVQQGRSVFPLTHGLQRRVVE